MFFGGWAGLRAFQGVTLRTLKTLKSSRFSAEIEGKTATEY